jgi:hypothetical protein
LIFTIQICHRGDLPLRKKSIVSKILTTRTQNILLLKEAQHFFKVLNAVNNFLPQIYLQYESPIILTKMEKVFTTMKKWLINILEPAT